MLCENWAWELKGVGAAASSYLSPAEAHPLAMTPKGSDLAPPPFYKGSCLCHVSLAGPLATTRTKAVIDVLVNQQILRCAGSDSVRSGGSARLEPLSVVFRSAQPKGPRRVTGRHSGGRLVGYLGGCFSPKSHWCERGSGRRLPANAGPSPSSPFRPFHLSYFDYLPPSNSPTLSPSASPPSLSLALSSTPTQTHPPPSVFRFPLLVAWGAVSTNTFNLTRSSLFFVLHSAQSC